MRRILTGFAVAVGAFGAFLLVFDPRAMWDALRGVDPAPFALGLLAVLLAVVCWAESMRRVLLAAGGTASPGRLFTAYSAGMFAKQVLPMGNAGGPAIMAYAVERETDLDFKRSLAVVTVGDFLGLLSTLVLALVGVAYVVLTVPQNRLIQAVQVGIAVFAVFLLSMAILLLYRRDVLRWVALGVARLLRDTVGQVFQRVEHALHPERVEANLDRYFETVDEATADPGSLLPAAGLALAGWTLFAVPLYTAAMAVDVPISFGLVLFVVPAGGLATLVPLPGGIGGVEFAVAGMVVALTGLDLAVAGAIVILYRLCVYWFLVLIGVASLVYTATSVSTFTTDVGSPTELSDRTEP